MNETDLRGLLCVVTVVPVVPAVTCPRRFLAGLRALSRRCEMRSRGRRMQHGTTCRIGRMRTSVPPK